jgi:LacI family transcriptional regulator
MRVILARHRALPAEPVRPAPIHVVTPFNLPG